MQSKKIWFLWLQGIDSAPHIVKCCYQSWCLHNPGWEIVLLNNSNLNEYLRLSIDDEKLKRLSNAAFSDLVRVNLLAEHGGVWCDATTFCTKPLDDWLDDYCKSGFFAFRNPGKDRVLSSWFLASEKDNHLTETLAKSVTDYWSKNNLKNKGKGPLITPFDYILNRSPSLTKYWFHPFITKLMRIHPYFYFHYLFAYLVDKDIRFKEIWHSTPVFEADIPHAILHNDMLGQLSATNKAHIDDIKSPLYKLSWKFSPEELLDNSSLTYLINTHLAS
jgi:hypothetical protein